MTGGIIDKLGNLYEAKGAVLGLLRVLRGDALSIQYESIAPQEHGADWFIRYLDRVELIQAKRSTTKGNWTIIALEREDVFTSAGEWLGLNTRNRFIFTSESPSPDIKGLCESANHTMDASSLLSSLSRPQRNNFEQLRSLWNISADNALDFLKRCSFETQAESQLDEFIQLYGSLVFRNSEKLVFPILRAYIEKRMGLELTNERIVGEIEHSGELAFRPQFDPALWEQLREANQIFDNSHIIFGTRTPIHRVETDRINEALQDEEGPRLILLTGNAGSGKSFILKEIIAELDQRTIPHLAFRVDKYLTAHSLDELGRFILGRDVNPLLTLTDYAGNKPSVLIIDQVDAIGEVSGRSGPMRELVLNLLDIAGKFNSVRVIAACRSYDLSKDPRLKKLANEKTVLTIQASPLDWAKDVEPLLLEKGFITSRMSPAMRSILTSPLNLAILLELGTEQDTDSLEECTDLSMLYDRLVSKKAERLTNIQIVKELASIARRMSEDHALDAPDIILEPAVIATLASEQLIVHARPRISFFHETFFDYVYARDFVGEGKSIVEFLKMDGQILFRRTQVRQILSYYRQTGGERRRKYFLELEEVLNSSDVRYHIKDGITSWLGSLIDPSERELDILLKLDTPESGMPYLVRNAIYPQTSWALILAKRGLLDQWIRSFVEARGNDAIAILKTLLRADQPMAVGIIESYWHEDPAALFQSVLRWLFFIGDIEPSESLIRFMCEVIAYNTGEIDRESSLTQIVPYEWYSRFPEAVGRLISAFFNIWFTANPDEHPFSNNRRDGIVPDHIFAELKKGNLEVYLNTVLPVFSTTIERIKRVNSHRLNDFTFYTIREGYDFGEYKFFHTIKASLAELVKYNPNKALECLNLVDPYTHRICLYLHLSTIAEGGSGLAEHFVSLLNTPKIMEAGPWGATWLPFAEATKTTLPFLAPDIHRRIEAMTLGYWPELSKASDIARHLKAGKENSYTSREDAYFYLHESGKVQWAILKTIGIEHFSPSVKTRFEMLNRKFTGIAIPEPQTNIGGWVSPPILPDRAKHMSNVQWVRAIENYSGDETSKRRRKENLSEMHSGASGLSQVLREQTKVAPERFAKLFMQLSSDANAEYGDAILHGLADNRIDIAILLPLLSRLNREHNRGFCSGFCQMVAARPELAVVDDTFELLQWYVENGPVLSSGEFEVQRIQQDIFSVDQLLDEGGMMVLHGDKAAAIRALSYVISNCAERRVEAITLLKTRVVKENAQCIRCALSEPISYMLETLIDKSEAVDLMNSLVIRANGFDPYPLTNYHGIFLLHRLLYLFPQKCAGIVESLLQFADEKVAQLGAYFVLYQTFYSIESSSDITASVIAKYEYRRIDAGLAAQFVAEDKSRELAAKKLIDYFDDPDEETRKSAAKCFRYLRDKPLEPYRALLDSYIRSVAFGHLDYFFYEFIKSAPDCTHDVIIAIGERVLELISANTNKDLGFDITTIGEMLNEEYAGAIDTPSLREKMLDLIDGMLQVGMYGVTQIVEEHERR